MTSALTDETPIAKGIRLAEDIQTDNARTRAADLAPKAIDTLEKLMAGRAISRGGDKPSPSVSLTAAKEILAQALGRPETRDPRTSDLGDRISITVLNLSTGTREPVDITVRAELERFDIPEDTRTQAAKAIELAERIQEEVKK